MDRTLAVIVAIALLAGASIYKLRQAIYSHPHHGVMQPAPSDSSSLNAPKGTCRGTDLRLRWPLDGSAGKDWVIANYFDEDPAIGKVQDFTGATGTDAVTYDGHDGVDIEIPSFRTMDQGVSIHASAEGVVEDTYDSAFDRNRVCSNDKWNFVTIRHANGFATTYGHMKKGSVIVHRGDHVSAGTSLGLVGSSGCSSHPHVHLDVTDCYGTRIDSVKENMFISLPPYSRSASSDVMETYVFQPAIEEMKQVQDPGATDTQLISVGHEFTAAMTVAYVRPGDLIRIDFLRPDNTDADFSIERSVDHFYPRSHWWGNFVLDEPGTWLVRFKVNGRILASRPIAVTQ
jgi:murein DD-endopeptidase MepM/ murein hydrolase activator NlpD